MDWIEADGGANRALESAFAVLNEGPPPMTARQQKTKKEQSRSWEEAGRQLMLEAFPRIYAQESEASRIERAEAFDTCWGVIEQHVQSAMESTDARVFASLLELAQRSHALCLQEANLLRRGLHPIPTGLVLAGGVNSADHVRTFPNLAAHLRQAGCYVALLPPSAFARSLAEALNSALRQLSGMGETSADQFEALAAWYAEEVGSGLPTATPPEAHPSAEDGDANGSRRLRARPMQEAAVVATQDQVANRGRPLVIVVESTEAVQPGTLEDLVSVLSEGYPRFPVTLVLGLTTTAAALHAALPSYLIDRALECHHFNLATAMARLDTLVEQVLLSKWPGLLLEGALVNTLWEHFLVHYFSPSIVVQGWKVAALEHFRTHPGALLVEAGLDGSTDALHAAVVGLHGAHATEIKRCVGGARGGASLADAVCAVPQAWRRWALGVHWMVIAAKATNLSNGYTYWQLYRDTLAPGFGSSARGKELLGRLSKALGRLHAPTAAALANRLIDVAVTSGAGDLQTCSSVQAATAELRAMVESFREAGDEASGAAAPSAQEPEEREEAQLAGEAAQDGPPKKRERFFSKASRAAAMLFKAKERGKGRQQAELDADAEQTAAAAEHGHATRLAKWLTAWLQAALHSPPTQLPAASIFTCSKSAAVDCLSAAPREAIHSALIHPETYLYTASGSSGPVQQLGMSAKTEDACLAYQLFDQDSAYGNVADWFTAFKDVHDAADGIAGGSGEGGKEGKGKTTAKEKDKFNQAKGKGKGSGSNGASNMGQSDSKRVQELAARFSQAAAELQFVGLLRQAKRRRGEHVQRAVHMPADLMGE